MKTIMIPEQMGAEVAFVSQKAMRITFSALVGEIPSFWGNTGHAASSWSGTLTTFWMCLGGFW